MTLDLGDIELMVYDLGGPIGYSLILKFNLVVSSGVSRRLSPAQMRAYRGPF